MADPNPYLPYEVDPSTVPGSAQWDPTAAPPPVDATATPVPDASAPLDSTWPPAHWGFGDSAQLNSPVPVMPDQMASGPAMASPPDLGPDAGALGVAPLAPPAPAPILPFPMPQGGPPAPDLAPQPAQAAPPPAPLNVAGAGLAMRNAYNTPEDQRTAQQEDMVVQSESPVAFAKRQADELTAQERIKNDKLDQANRWSLLENEKNFRILKESEDAGQRSREQLAQDAQNIAEHGRDHFFQTRNTMQKISLFASAAIDGYLNPGGPNGTIDLIEKEIDRDLDGQWKALGTRENLLSQQLASGRTMYEARNAFRVATFDNLAKQAEIDAQRFDPNGTAAIRRRQFADVCRSNIAKAMQEQHDRAVKEHVMLGELGVKQYEAQTGRMKANADIGKTGQLTPEQQLARQDKVAAETSQTRTMRAKDPSTGKIVSVPLKAPTKDKLDAFEKADRETAAITSIANQVEDIRDSMGTLEKGSPIWSEKKRELESLKIQGERLLAKEDGGQLSVRNKEIMDDAFGDPTSIRGSKALAGLRSVVKNKQEDFKRLARDTNANIDLDQIEYLQPRAKAPKQTEAQMAVAGLNSSDPETVHGSLEGLHEFLQNNPTAVGSPEIEKGLENAEKVAGKDAVKPARELVKRTYTDSLFRQELPDVSETLGASLTSEQKMAIVKAKQAGDPNKVDQLLHAAIR